VKRRKVKSMIVRGSLNAKDWERRRRTNDVVASTAGAQLIKHIRCYTMYRV